MKILVVSSYFGPETSIGVLRVNSFVKFWTKLGHTVHVVTTPFSGSLPSWINGNQRIEIFQVAPMFIKSLKSGEEQGYAKGATGIKRKIIEFQYYLKREYFANYLDPRLFWWPKAACYINAKLVTTNKYDFIFSTVPSYTAHSAAAYVKMANRNLIWVADYRDLWSGNPIFPGIHPVRFIERKHEKYILKRADLIVSINDDLITELSKLHGVRRYCIIPNGFEDEEIENYGKLTEMKFSTKVSIVYAGSLIPGLQNPTPLLKAIKELSEERRIREGDLGLYFYGDYSALKDFSLTNNKTVSKYILRCGKVARHQILEIQKSADILLFLGSKPVANGIGSTTGVVSGKIYEYMISGTEIMAVGVTKEMLVAEMITKAKVGRFYSDDVVQIKNRISAAVQNGVKKVLPDMTYLNQFRRSKQALKLISEVQNIIL